MATIAFAGNGTDRFYDCCYYILTEAGDLWYMTLRTASGEYRISYKKLGSVGLNLTGVSTVTGGMYASMTYDPTRDICFCPAACRGRPANSLPLTPETLLWAKLGDFGQGVRLWFRCISMSGSRS